jgi:hypothetical protein
MRALTVILAFAAVPLAAGLLAWAPALVSFGLAACAAGSWCFWLERHPAA